MTKVVEAMVAVLSLIMLLTGLILIVDGRQQDGGIAIVVIASFGLLAIAFNRWMARRGYPIRDEHQGAPLDQAARKPIVSGQTRWQLVGAAALGAAIVSIRVGGIVTIIVISTLFVAFVIGLAYETVRDIRRANS